MIRAERYYDDHLCAHRLKRCYEIAPPRVQQYLEAEIEHVLRHVRSTDSVLELGCGYGRVLAPLARRARVVIGIDTSLASLHLAGHEIESGRCHLICMDASRLGFADGTFDCVICIQNGTSAFHVDQRVLIRESVRVTKPGGIALFSSYAARFWDHRLEWFRMQVAEGLLGEIDYEKTGDGVIVCKDGFTATTLGPDEFRDLTSDLDAQVGIEEVDGSSLFCEIVLQ